MPRLEYDDLFYASGTIVIPTIAYLLESACEAIAAAGKMTATASNKIVLMQQLGIKFDVIEAEMKRLLRKSRKDLDQLFRDYAAEHYAADYERLKLSYVPFEENTSLQQIVAAYTRLAEDDLSNVTRTMGFVDGSGKVIPVFRNGKVNQSFYADECWKAFDRVVLGAQDYNSAVRDITKNIAAKGVRTIDYKSGVHRSVESAARLAIMGGLGLMAEQITLMNAEILGADGWEMSAHALSAPDHSGYQGKQYTAEEWTEINGIPPKQGDPANKPVKPAHFEYEYKGVKKVSTRRVGTLNCGHNVFPILLGINEPQYTEDQLQKMKADNDDGFTDETPNGKKVHYTGYEATQRMREIERTIRSWEKEYTTAVFTENPEQTQIASSNLVRWRQEYARFSRAAGLRQQVDRNFVAGFSEAVSKAKKLGFIVPRLK